MEIVDKRYLVTYAGITEEGQRAFKNSETGELIFVNCNQLIGMSIISSARQFILRQLPGGSCILEGYV